MFIVKKICVALILFTLLLGYSVDCISQISRYTKYSKSDGLLSNFVYRVVEDMDGNIWACTSGGVCKYNGIEIKCFDRKEGLPDQDIYKITLDELGRLWLFHASNKIAFIQNDSVHVYPTKSSARLQFQFYNNIENQGVRIGTDYYAIDGNNNVSISTDYRYNQNSTGLIWHNLFIGSADGGDSVIVYNNKEGSSFEINHLSEVSVEVQTICQYHEPTNTFQLYSGNQLYVYDTTLVYIETIPINLPENVNILSAIKDRWGNIWVCTRNGLFFQSYVQRLHDTQYINEFTDKNIIRVLKYEDDLIVIDDSGFIYKYTDRGIFDIAKIQMRGGLIYNVEIVENKLYLSNGSTGFVKINLENTFFETQIDKVNSRGVKDFSFVSNNRVLSSGRIFSEINVSENNFEILKKEYYKNIEFNNASSQVWINTNDSLFVYDYSDSLHLLQATYFPLIENMKYIDNDKLLISTVDGNLYQCNIDSKIQIEIESRVRSIKIINGKVFLNNETGLYTPINDLSIDSLLKFEMYFDYKSLQSDIVVNDISVHRNNLFLGTNVGLLSIKNVNVNSDKLVIPTYIKSLNGNKITDEIQQVEYDNRSLEISFSSSYYGNRDRLKYLYALEGWKEKIDTTNAEVLRFGNVSPGDYIFRVKSFDTLGNSSEWQSINIKIKKPWYHNIFVYIIAFIFAFIFILFIFRSYIANVNKKNHLQQQLAELELSALQSQMNPHFVFNAMNSIQNLIISDKPEEADLYVSKLAKLMRKYLDSSKEKYIKIEDELNIVRLYLQLEELRFGEKISYHIENSLPSRFLSLRIPATIIQPFVENALKHGLFHKGNRGNLYVRLYNEANDIHIEIEDDGVGRERVLEIQKASHREHKSTGMKSIEDKLEVLRKLDKIDISCRIEDLYKDTIPSGTKVKISISNI